MIALKYDHVFSPTFINELGGSYFLSTVSQNSPLAGTDLATQWGIQNVVIPGFPSTNNIPQIQFQSGPTVRGVPPTNHLAFATGILVSLML